MRIFLQYLLKKPCQIMFWRDAKEDFLQELHMKYCTNSNRYNSVIRFLLSQMCRRHFSHRANKWSLERLDFIYSLTNSLKGIQI